MKLPIFVARQVIRHRTARLNEISGRYSVMKDEFYVPEPGRVQKQSADNKQGSGEAFEAAEAQRLADEMAAEQREVYGHYEGYIEANMARELARLNLPLSLYTEWYWQIDLHNLFHFMRLRLDWHAQYEVRVYAEALAHCAKAVAPLCYNAFEEHVRHGERLSRSELEALRRMLKGEAHGLGERQWAELEKKLYPPQP
jgi:thymidylate synthase (FAD)